jgi:hypothetical protein
MSVPYEQNRVSQAVWPWAGGSAPKQAGGANVRRRALSRFALATAPALLLGWVLHAWIMALVVQAVASVLGLSGVLLPRFFEFLDRLMARFGTAVGQGLTWLLLVPFFYAFFTPTRLILRLRGRDPLNRGFPSGEPTYWIPYRARPDPARYRRQFS